MTERCRSASFGDHGYTLLEASVSILIMSIVISAALGTYLTANRMIGRWHQRMLHDNAAHLILMQVAEDVRNADIVVLNKDNVRLQELSGKETVYGGLDGTVQRDGHAFFEGDRGQFYLDIRLDTASTMQNGSVSSRTYRIHLLAVSNTDTSRLHILVRPRTEPSWSVGFHATERLTHRVVSQ